MRILIEPVEQELRAALMTIDAIEKILDIAHIGILRLLHRYENAAWPLLNVALKRGYDTRIGLEATLYLPDGGMVCDNAELVAFARQQISR